MRAHRSRDKLPLRVLSFFDGAFGASLLGLRRCSCPALLPQGSQERHARVRHVGVGPQASPAGFRHLLGDKIGRMDR